MKLNELLGIEFPIIQGGMANIATGAFAAAVSNAGALGLVASGGMDAEALRAEIRAAKANTGKPFGVNLMLMNPHIDALAKVAARFNGGWGPFKKHPPGSVAPKEPFNSPRHLLSVAALSRCFPAPPHLHVGLHMAGMAQGPQVGGVEHQRFLLRVV